MDDLNFKDLAEFIRRHAQLSPGKLIGPDTQFERDLGITGDDGVELLEAVEKEFEILLTRDSFDLAPNEFLFNPEGFSAFGDLIALFRRRPIPEVRSFTAGGLFDAVTKAVRERAATNL